MKTAWTFENLQTVALKYNTRTAFKKGDSRAYHAAHRMGAIDEVCRHMPKWLSRLGKESARTEWSFEKLQEAALKYKNRGDFAVYSRSAYYAATRLKILDKICSHMNPSTTQAYTAEELQEKADTCSTKIEFRDKYPNEYAASHKKGRAFFSKICSHMPIDLKSGGKPHNYKWTYEKLELEALKHKRKVEFSNSSPGAYMAAQRKNVLNEICSHMARSTESSTAERELFDIIKSFYPKAQKMRDMKVKIPNKSHVKGFDIDIYIPELRRGIEFDGTYWHSDAGLKRSRSHWPQEDVDGYHKIKDAWFASKGIQIIHIKEEDWIENKQACIDKCLIFLELYALFPPNPILIASTT